MKQPALISNQLCISVRHVLKDAREAADLSFNELSKRSGVNRRAIAMIEGGDRIPSIETFVKLSAALGIGPTELFARAQNQIGQMDWKKFARELEKTPKG